MRERTGLFAGLLLIALVNAVILAGVAWNRSGGTEAQVELTERELEIQQSFRGDEDSGLALGLRRSDWSDWTDKDWLDREKLRELGFDVRVDAADPKAEGFYRNVLARRGFVVLQMEGDAWYRRIAAQERALEELKTNPETAREDIEVAKETLERDRRMASRLLAVDAGPDPERLRGRYPDRSQYLILPAEFRLWYRGATQDSSAKISGLYPELLVDEVHVPLELRPVLDEARRRRDREGREEWKEQTPLYRIVLAVGRRYEPRLVRVEALP